MLQDTVDKVALAPPPHTKKTAASLFRPKKLFIEKYAEIAAPLTDALKGGKSSPWKSEHSQAVAFNKLRELLCAKPILRLPDMEKPFTLRTDVSDVGLEAVLLQEQEDGKLTKAERNYAVVEKECLDIVWGVAKFYRYPYGRQFVLQPDHQPLVFLDRAKLCNARVTVASTVILCLTFVY